MSSELLVAKMSGSGNDFIVVGPASAARLGAAPADWVRRVCRRGLSIGADGVLFVEPLDGDRVGVRFYNPDGSSAFCGNGSRCAARYANLEGWVGNTMLLETAAGEIAAEIVDRQVRLRLGPPTDRGMYDLELEGRAVPGRFVHSGTPHVVIIAPSFSDDTLRRWGPRVRRDPRFGETGTNLDLAWPGAQGSVHVRTWERGVEGETLACGSGAIAVAFALRLDGGPAVTQIIPRSGIPLRVHLPGPPASPQHAALEGDARMVLRGRVDGEATE